MVLLAIGIYLSMSLSGARSMLRHEESARQRLKTFYRLEREAVQAPSTGRYVLPSQLSPQPPDLQNLKAIPLKDNTNTELFSDGAYLYHFRLESPPRRAEDYLAGKTGDKPRGFMILAWPVRFGATGEMAFYIDEQGRMARSTNRDATHDGFKDFPPDYTKVLETLQAQEKRTGVRDWMVESKL
jgi:hypothetical protein